MSPTQILFTKSDSILARGVVSVLEREMDFVLMGTQLEPDSSLLIDPEQPRPDLVVVEVGDGIPVPTQLSQIFEYLPLTPIIVINSQENWVKLYDLREIFIREPAELVSVIRNIKARKEAKKGETS